jgi:hypothetical protein
MEFYINWNNAHAIIIITQRLNLLYIPTTVSDYVVRNEICH